MSIIVRKATESEKNEMRGYPTWGCEVSEFDWYYDEHEECYLVDGDVTVTYGGESVTFGEGDYVIFPQGLSCRWQVKKPVKKHYFFK